MENYLVGRLAVVILSFLFLAYLAVFDIIKKRMISDGIFFIWALLIVPIKFLFGQSLEILVNLCLAGGVVLVCMIGLRLMGLKDVLIGEADIIAAGFVWFSFPSLEAGYWAIFSLIAGMLYWLCDGMYYIKSKKKKKALPMFPFLFLGYVMLILVWVLGQQTA